MFVVFTSVAFPCEDVSWNRFVLGARIHQLEMLDALSSGEVCSIWTGPGCSYRTDFRWDKCVIFFIFFFGGHRLKWHQQTNDNFDYFEKCLSYLCSQLLQYACNLLHWFAEEDGSVVAGNWDDLHFGWYALKWYKHWRLASEWIWSFGWVNYLWQAVIGRQFHIIFSCFEECDWWAESALNFVVMGSDQFLVEWRGGWDDLWVN